MIHQGYNGQVPESYRQGSPAAFKIDLGESSHMWGRETNSANRCLSIGGVVGSGAGIGDLDAIPWQVSVAGADHGVPAEPCPWEQKTTGKRMCDVHPAREQNSTQTILSVVCEGYKFSVSSLVAFFPPLCFLLCLFICQSKGPE